MVTNNIYSSCQYVNSRKILFFLFLFFTIVTPVQSDSSQGFVITATVSDPDESYSVDTSKLSLKLSPQGSYKAARGNVLLTKQKIKRKFIECKNSNDSLYQLAQKALEECIVNKLIPFWYGTPWDFNGYTPTPNKGVIACGYFVSTVMLHAGFVLNRYTLAQQAPYFEAVSLQLNDSIQVYKNGFADFYEKFKKRNVEGLYFAGLDNHVGFLLYRKNDLLFIHSSYVEPLCVTIEIAEQSPAFTAVRTYNIAEISTNRKLLDYWLNDKTIAIRTK